MILNVHYPEEASCKIPTEDTIRNNLISNNLVPEEFVLINTNWTKIINKFGIIYTQKIVNNVFEKIKKLNFETNKVIVICQHISVDKIKWHTDLVFTPHATFKNNFISIPHFAYNKGVFNKNKNRLASFMGSFETHTIRQKISKLSNNEITIIDSGVWYHYQPDDIRKNKYIDLLSTSKFTFCPRGTGPSTIRIWEALASGSIPVIISDNLKMPKSNFDWNDIALFVKEDNVSSILNVIKSISKDKVYTMSQKGFELYNKYFDNTTMHNIIVEHIND